MVLLILASGRGFAEFQTFTNGEGHSIEAELLELKEGGDVVRIRLRDGRELDAKLTAFSAEDRAAIGKWWDGVLLEKSMLAARSRIDVTVKLNRKAKSERYSAWWVHTDDRVRSFFPEIIIENDEMDRFSGNTVRVVVLAKDMRDDEQLLVVSATTLEDVTFPDLGSVSLESEPFRLRQYEHKNTYGSAYNYEFGYEYEGYVVLIKNARGEVTHTKSSKSKFLSAIEVVMKCKAGEIYDADFNRKLNLSPNSYYIK